MRIARVAAGMGALFAALAIAPPAFADDNLPPVNAVPGAQTTNEDTSRSFSASNATPNGISVSDPDAGANAIQVALSVANGTLTLGATTNLGFAFGDGTGDTTMTFTGTIADIDAALEGMTYAPAANYNGDDSLNIATDDLGNSGSGGALTDSDSVAITVSAVNDNPVNAVPGAQVTVEETPLAFSPGAGNAISVSDVDAAGAIIRVTLDGRIDGAVKGTISLSLTTGLTFTSGDGADDSLVVATGTIADINAALEGMTFTPVQNLLSGARLRITTSDLGSTGSGGSKTDTDDVDISATNTDDPPDVLVRSGVGTYRDVPLELSLANLNQVQVNDVDAPASDNTVEIALAITGGTLTFDTLAGMTVLDGADGSAAIALRGVRSSVTGAFDTGVTFTPDPGFTGQATVAIDASEPGTGPLSESELLSIEVDEPSDTIYWTASKDTVPGIPAGLGRAALDGSGGANLLTGPELMDTPGGIAIDAVESRIYWANTGATAPADRGIWSASLAGTDKQLFLTSAAATAAGTKLNSAFNMAIDQGTRRLYWANSDNVTSANRGISYVSLDNPATGGRVDTGSAKVGSPRGLALDLADERVYWTNWSMTQSISYAPLPGASGPSGDFTVSGVNQPSGVALDVSADRLFWANGSGTAGVDEAQRIKVATIPTPFSSILTASALDIGPNPGGGLRTPALDPTANRVYWANSSLDRISYANLGGTGGGADLPTGGAYTNSPDGVAILRRPASVSPPAISGTPEVGSVLTCDAAEWAPDLPSGALYRMPASETLGWTRDDTSIEGATDATYTVAAAGEHRCTRIASNFAGATSSESPAVTVVAPPAPPPPPPPPPAVPPPPPSVSLAKLTLGSSRAPISTSGVAAIPVDCAAALCAGTIRLTTAKTLTVRSGPARKKRTIRAGTTLGEASLSVAAGTRATVPVELSATGRALAGTYSSISASATTTLAGAAAGTTALTLTPARAPAITPVSRSAPARNGRVAVRLRCAAPLRQTCRGTLTLKASTGGRSATIAARKLSLRGARTSPVSLMLTRTARVALARGRLPATQRAESTIAVGRATSHTAFLRITG